MIRIFSTSPLLTLLLLFNFWTATSNHVKSTRSEKVSDEFQSEVEILSITTTSRSQVWSPSRVITNGILLEWKASANGMADQIVLTSGSPTFDLSVSRNSDVTISITSNDGLGTLIELIINSLNISEINFSNSDTLTKLSCTDNQIKRLDLTNCPALSELFCHSNQLSELDVSINSDLSILACFRNQIEVLDLANNAQLSSLSCSSNILSELNLANNTELISLECEDNNLESLTIKNGNNTIVTKFETRKNPALFCIEVDDRAYAESNWINIDPWTQFSEDCTFTNYPPVALDDFYDVDENTLLTVEEESGVLANDTDPNDDPLLAVLNETVSEGTLELFPDGSFTYEPFTDFFGKDSFTYYANDGEFNSNLARVTIEVFQVNSPPEAVDDFYQTQENLEIIVTAIEGVLANDIDPDNDPLTASLISDAIHGNLRFESDGSFSYQPDQGFNGTDSFTYKAFDGYEYSNTAEVTLIVEAYSNIEMPNAFTPNNDDLNDTFRPVFVGMLNVELKVFDTWNNLIYYESGATLTGWDGSINSQKAENGNYMYQVRATSNTNEDVSLDGIFTLIR